MPKNKTIFSVTSPLDFDREVTVSKLRKWVQDLDLKFLVIDGLTYLKNERTKGHQPEHERLTDITEDLMTLSNELLIPIVVVVQANREGARDSNGEISNDTPEIDTIRGSDGISHNASRVISVRCKDSTLTLYLNKNITITLIEPGAYLTGFNQVMIDNKDKFTNYDSKIYKNRKFINRIQRNIFFLVEKKDYTDLVKKVGKEIYKKKPKFRIRRPIIQSVFVKIYLILFG